MAETIAMFQRPTTCEDQLPCLPGHVARSLWWGGGCRMPELSTILFWIRLLGYLYYNDRWLNGSALFKMHGVLRYCQGWMQYAIPWFLSGTWQFPVLMVQICPGSNGFKDNQWRNTANKSSNICQWKNNKHQLNICMEHVQKFSKVTTGNPLQHKQQEDEPLTAGGGSRANTLRSFANIGPRRKRDLQTADCEQVWTNLTNRGLVSSESHFQYEPLCIFN